MTTFGKWISAGALMLGAACQLGTVSAAAQTTATSQLTVVSGLGNATGVGVDQFGNLYYTDGASGQVNQLPGANGTNANLLSVTLSGGGQIAVDRNMNVYAAGGPAHAVYEYTYTNNALNVNSPVSLGSNLGAVTGVAVDLSGNLYAVDNTNKQVVKISGTSQTVLMSGLNSPQQIAVDKSGGLYVADSGANAIVYLPAGSTTSQSLGTGLNAPHGVAVDASGDVFIADTGNGAIKEIPYKSGLSNSNEVTLPWAITTPTSIAVDTWGSLYVAGATSVYHLSSGAVYLGLVQVAETSAIVPVTITFTSALAPATIKVVTTGLTGLDWADAGTGTCKAGATYSAGSTCTMDVTFTPQFPGPRMGAIVFYDANNKVISRTFLGGSGLGPMMTYDTLPANSNTLSIQPGNPASALYPNNASVNPYPTPISQPHGGRFDAAGNLFLADYGSGKVIEFPANASQPVTFASGTGLQDLAINGAGDIVVPNTQSAGTIVLFPDENGTWNPADAVTLASGLSKPRTITVDLLGNTYTCDTGNNKVYRISPAGVATQILSGVSKGCLGVAIDGYGNLAVTDGSAKVAWYAPANGATPYSVGTGLSSPWGLQFDASGSLYISDNGAAQNLRIPNENGTLVSSHQEKIDGNKNYGFALDNYGNMVTFPSVGTTVPTYYNYNVISRSSPSPFFVGVSLAATANVAPYVVGNAGTQAPEFSNGLVALGDIDDFSNNGQYIGSWSTLFTSGSYSAPQCNFSTTVQPGTVCYIGVSTVSTEIGGTRTEWLQLPTQAPYITQAKVTGGSGTGPTQAASLTVTISPTAPTPGQAITVTVSAGSGPTGAVTLEVDGALTQAQELNSGKATFTIADGLALGTHTIGAIYAGDQNYAAVTKPVTTSVIVNGITPTLMLAASAKDVLSGQTVTLTADVATASGSAAPTGTVKFLDGSTLLGTVALSNGSASFATSTLPAGTHTITFSYSGDTVYAAATSASTTVTVGTYSTTTVSLSVLPSQPNGGYVYGTKLTATATVSAASGTPTGSIIFNLDGQVQTVALTGTSAALSLTPGGGTHVLTASYTGDANYDTSSAATTFTTQQEPTTTTMSISSTSFPAGSNVTMKAVVSSALTPPTGTVAFRNGLSVIGTASVDSTGTATLTTYKVPCGTDQLTANYLGDTNNHESFSSAIAVTASCNPTTVSESANPIVVTYISGTSAATAVTANINSMGPSNVIAPIGGSVTFTDQNGNLIGSGNVQAGTGSYQWVNPVPGTIYTVTANYSGDNYYLPSVGTTRVCVAPTSGPYPGDYSVSMNPSPLNVSVGTPATATISISSTNSYCGYIQLTCSNLPAYSDCVMSPTQVTMDGTTKVQTVTLTVNAQASYQTARVKLKNTTAQLCTLLGAPFLSILFMGSFARGRKLLRSAGMRSVMGIVLLALIGAGATACGSHTALATPPGTYTVDIVTTGTGGVNHSTPVQMTFK